jgi:hypothetical protein
MNSATGFSSNVTDLITFYRHHQYGDETFLADRHKREMQRIQFADDAFKWGLGFEIGKSSGMNYVGHGGGYPGFITYSLLVQQHKLVIIVLTNGINPFPQELAFGLMDILKIVADTEAQLTEENDADTKWLEKISGFYSVRWGPQLFQRVGNRMILMNPDVLRPSTAMSLGEQDGNTFRWVTGMQNGVFGESHVIEEIEGETVMTRGDVVTHPFKFDY